MSFFKDKMSHHIVLLAGGLGSRLENTEIRPKPLVDINGLSLISRIILSFYKTKLFKKFHILTCLNSDLFKEILKIEIPNIDYKIYTEEKRTGRLGALKFFLNSQSYIDRFFVCNADTIFLNLIQSEIERSVERFKKKPIVFLAEQDTSRNDYKKITLSIGNKFRNYQNSGLVYLSREWFNLSVLKNKKFMDIDEHLFHKDNLIEMSLLSTSLIDAGTPKRLKSLRDIYK